MATRLIKLGMVLGNACRLTGRNPALQGVPDSWKVMAAFAVNEGLRKIYAEKFGMLRRIERRQYRPTWAAEIAWVEGNECFYGGHYWRLDGSDGTVAPEAEGSSWTKLTMEEVSAFIAFDQPWETVEMDPGGVDIQAFAYEADPKYHPDAAPLRGLGWFEDGVLLPSPAPETVWVRFMPLAPRISYTDWSATVAYEPGDVVYVPSTREVYEALQAVAAGGTSPASDTADNWRAVQVPDAFEDYLTRLAASALLTEDQGKFQSQAQADAAFDDLVDRFTHAAGETRMRTGRFRR